MPPDHAVFKLAESASEPSVEFISDGIAERSAFVTFVQPEGADVAIDRDGFAAGRQIKIAVFMWLPPALAISAGLRRGKGGAYSDLASVYRPPLERRSKTMRCGAE